MSCYLEEVVVDSAEGSAVVPKEHVRFSVWVDDRAVAAVSLTHDEARELASFLEGWLPERADSGRAGQASRGTAAGPSP